MIPHLGRSETSLGSGSNLPDPAVKDDLRDLREGISDFLS